jgi:hypothetical protein
LLADVDDMIALVPILAYRNPSAFRNQLTNMRLLTDMGPGTWPNVADAEPIRKLAMVVAARTPTWRTVKIQHREVAEWIDHRQREVADWLDRRLVRADYAVKRSAGVIVALCSLLAS